MRIAIVSGAIIGKGDRRRISSIGVGPIIWDKFSIFITNGALSPAAHARTRCEDFCGCRAGEMTSEILEIVYAFGPQLNAFIWLLEFCRSIFGVSYFSLSEVRQCRI